MWIIFQGESNDTQNTLHEAYNRTSMAGFVIGAAVNGVYIFREITASGIDITAVMSLVLGILGGGLTYGKRNLRHSVFSLRPRFLCG